MKTGEQRVECVEYIASHARPATCYNISRYFYRYPGSNTKRI